MSPAREEKLQQSVQAKGILALYHFTRLENLASILSNGLIPRRELRIRGIAATMNDDERRDGDDATSLSISFPNYRMFYKHRQADPNAHWCVLALSPSVLWKSESTFYSGSASSALSIWTNREYAKSVDAFEELFILGSPVSRLRETDLPACYPTQPDAEVRVLTLIETCWIDQIHVQSKEARNIARTMVPREWRATVSASPELFMPRDVYIRRQSSGVQHSNSRNAG